MLTISKNKGLPFVSILFINDTDRHVNIQTDIKELPIPILKSKKMQKKKIFFKDKQYMNMAKSHCIYQKSKWSILYSSLKIKTGEWWDQSELI